MSHFDDPDVAARYAGGPPRMVPGFAVMLDLVDRLLTEHLGDDGRVLVLGAGGGLELTHLAERHAGWTFDGVDPAKAMLDQAGRALGPHAGRVTLHHGIIDDAPDGPFDAATCLLTLHFLEREERLRTVAEVRRRLAPGAPFVTFHHSVPDGATRMAWLERFVRFAGGGTAEGMARLPTLSPQDDAAVLREAGFRDVETFYAALTFHGWLAFA